MMNPQISAESLPPNPASNQSFDDIILDIRQEHDVKKTEKNQVSFLELYDRLNSWLIMQSNVSIQDKLLFFELMVTMVNAGISVPDGLGLLAKQTTNEKLKLIILGIQKSMLGGKSFAAAMSTYADTFDEATCSIIEAGEGSGKLSEVMMELVNQYERMNVIAKKVKSAMIYPAVVVTMMILLIIVVLVVIVPRLEGLFGGTENLPTPTRMLISASDFVTNNWLFLLLGIITAGFLFRTWINSQSGKEQFSAFNLKLPIIGDFVKKSVLSRFTRIFGFLIASGVPIIEGLHIAADVAGNPVYQKKILLAADDMTRGIEISENFADDEGLFPKMLVRMIAIGEKTSSLGRVMNKVADFYDDELSRKVDTMSKLMEPIILVFMAVGAIFLILAIYLPILQMNDQFL